MIIDTCKIDNQISHHCRLRILQGYFWEKKQGSESNRYHEAVSMSSTGYSPFNRRFQPTEYCYFQHDNPPTTSQVQNALKLFTKANKKRTNSKKLSRFQ